MWHRLFLLVRLGIEAIQSYHTSEMNRPIFVFYVGQVWGGAIFPKKGAAAMTAAAKERFLDVFNSLR